MPKNQMDNLPSALDGETRQQILKVAEELFLARGYKGVAMKDVADVVHITPAALYYHFPQGKEDLFMSVIQAMFEAWATGISHVVTPTGQLQERLRLLTQYLLTLPVDRFPILMQDAREHMKDREKQRMVFKQIHGMFTDHIAAFFQQAKDAGEISIDIPIPVLASMYYGMVIALLQYTQTSGRGTEGVDAPCLATMLISVLLDGIRSPIQQVDV